MDSFPPEILSTSGSDFDIGELARKLIESSDDLSANIRQMELQIVQTNQLIKSAVLKHQTDLVDRAVKIESLQVDKNA